MKTFKKILLRVLLSALLICVGVCVFRRWFSGKQSDNGILLYTEASAYAVDADAVTAYLQENSIDAASQCVASGTLAENAVEKINDGYTYVLLGLENASDITDDVLAAAEDKQAFLILFGSYPGDNCMNSYDKVYYAGTRSELIGELAGKECAYAYRNGSIPDANENLLLDYLTADLSSDSDTILSEISPSFLTECEHYGVYTQYAVSQAVDSEEDEDEAEEEIDDETDEEDAETVTFSANAQQLAEQWYDLRVSPEIILCGDTASYLAAREYADFTFENSVSYYVHAFTEEDAKALSAAGCSTVTLYDVESCTACVKQLVINLRNRQYIGTDIDLVPDEYKCFWTSPIIYSTANVPVEEETEEETTDEAAGETSAQQG